MSRFLRILNLAVLLVVIVAAFLQWMVILERTWSVFWMWFKFYGYDGGGHTVVSKTTQIVFYILSGIVASSGFVISRLESANTNNGKSIKGKIAIIFTYILVFGILFWTCILVSPLVRFQ